MNTSFVFFADGFEEIEAIAPVDIMRRAGMDIKTVSITENRTVRGAHGVEVVADATFGQCDFSHAEWLILPGGMPGASNLHACDRLSDLLIEHSTHGKIAAICASPAVVLAPLGLLNGREATCYPGFESACEAGGAMMQPMSVVPHPDLITANGPGAAYKFGLAIVANSMGEAVARDVADGMRLQ